MTATAHGASLGYTLSTARGDGTTDDTTAIQAAINACPTGGTVFLPAGTYKLTAPLSITKAITLQGAGSHVLFGSRTAFGGDTQDVPMQSPYLAGTVLKQFTAANDAVQIRGSGFPVHLKGFGITWDSSLLFLNTGHGISAVPTLTIGSGYDHGNIRCRWENLDVFGHDGNHYAYYLRNHLYDTFDFLGFYGGGGIFFENDSSVGGGNFGNLLVNHLYGQLFCRGTAEGIRLKMVHGTLNLIQFNRPQISVTDRSGLVAPYNVTVCPANQRTINCDTGVTNLSIIQPDFEFGVGPTNPGAVYPTSSLFIDPSGLAGKNPPWTFLQTGYVGREMRSDLVTQFTDDHTGLSPLGIYNAVTGKWGPSMTGDGTRIVRGFLNTGVPRPSARDADIAADPVTATTTSAPVYSDGTNWSDLWSAPTITALTDVANLQFDLKPDALGLADNTKVATFTNNGGTGANFTQGTGAAQPTYRNASGFQVDSGAGTVVFASGQSISSVTNTPTGGFTDFYILRPTVLGAGVDRLLFDSTTGGALRVYLSAINPYPPAIVTVGTHAFASPPYGIPYSAGGFGLGPGLWSLLTIRYDATTGHLDYRIDSTPLIAQATDIQSLVAGATRFGVGFEGQMGRAVRYSAALSDANMKSVEKYLRNYARTP